MCARALLSIDRCILIRTFTVARWAELSGAELSWDHVFHLMWCTIPIHLDIFHWLEAKCSSRFILICYSWAANTWEKRYRSPPARICTLIVFRVSLNFALHLFFSLYFFLSLSVERRMSRSAYSIIIWPLWNTTRVAKQQQQYLYKYSAHCGGFADTQTNVSPKRIS